MFAFFLSKLFALLCLISSVYLLHLLRLFHKSEKFIAKKIFYLNIIWIYRFFKNHPWRWVFHNIKLSNLKNVLQRNLRTDRPGSAFLEDHEAQVLKNFLLSGNHGGVFVGSMYILVFPKNIGYVTACANKNIATK